MPAPKIRSERLEARIAPEMLAFVRRAAEIEGRSLSEFVVRAAEAAAERTIEATHLVRLGAADQRRFVEAMLDAADSTPAMRSAHDHRRRLIGDT